MAATTVEPFNDPLPAVEAAQVTYPLSTDMMMRISYTGLSKVGGQDKSTNKHLDMQWKVIMGALTYGGRIYMPVTFCNEVIGILHDHPACDHIGALRTAECIACEFNRLQ